jgi:hypothetical protein
MLSFPDPKILSGSAKTAGGRKAAIKPKTTARHPTTPIPTYGNSGNSKVIDTVATKMRNFRCPAHLSEIKPVIGVANEPAISKVANKSDKPGESP